MTNEELDRVLDCPMTENDSQADTVRGYLTALLLGVWVEEEGFDGKRPFGNSSWKWDVFAALVLAGIITGKVVTEDGYTYVDDISKDECDKAESLVEAAIKRLGGVSS